MDKKLIDNTLFRLLRWFYVEEAGEAVLFSQLTGSPLFLDSIQVYEFMMAIENEFRIVFTSADIPRTSTAGFKSAHFFRPAPEALPDRCTESFFQSCRKSPAPAAAAKSASTVNQTTIVRKL